MIDRVFDIFFSHSLLNVYMFCVFVSLITSVYFVIIPLNKLRIEYGFSVRDKEKENKKRKIIKFLNGPEQNEKNLRKIRQYLFSEMIVSILPLLAVLVFRLYLGKPSNIEYNPINVIKMAKNTIDGHNQNEVVLIAKKAKNIGFFEKFFHFFS